MVNRPRWSRGYHTRHWDPRFAGSNPPGSMDFFQSVKILSSFGREVKPSRGSRVIDLRHVKEPQAEIRASEKGKEKTLGGPIYIYINPFRPSGYTVKPPFTLSVLV